MTKKQIVVKLARPCGVNGCKGTMMPTGKVSFDWGDGGAMVDLKCTRCDHKSMTSFAWNSPDDLGEQCMHCGKWFDRVNNDDDEETLCRKCDRIEVEREANRVVPHVTVEGMYDAWLSERA